MSKRIKALGWPLGLGLMLVSACWVAGMFGVGILLIPTIIVGAVVAMLRKSWILFVMVAALNPLSMYYARGIADYWGGAPSIWSMGLPRIESFNVDPVNRCFWSSGGCILWGNEWVYIDRHNSAVRFMLHFFGPPSKSYDGPYPSKEEASHLVSDAPPTPVHEFLEGKIHVGGETIELPPKLISRLVEGLGLFMLKDLPDDHYDAKIQAVLYQHRCIVLRLFVESIVSDGQRETESDLMIFFDRKTARPFAYFNSKGSGMTRFPPVPYLPEQEWMK